ncbi:penicillin-binding protein 2 [Ostreibacterium oceani]|uniref:Penicillin-binding protein 2 n=1 Tax=Ostreibacterium oceani TaxID=2654998 RepID=A0A6N7EV33_9GAMM|nr:penicillin-binding protein 2 [Ostreibacterium oceani]MPV86421.1 penicillin-binding protein 2 [Ostreibacterium oceani]
MRVNKKKKRPVTNPTPASHKKHKLTDSVLFTRRAIITLLGVLTGVFVLLSRAYYLQMTKHDFYRTKSNQNRVRLQVSPPLRGNIFDKKGRALTENILSYDLVVNRSKTENLDTLIEHVARYMRFDQNDRERFESSKKKKRHTEAVVVRADLSETEMSRFLVDLYQFPGFEVMPSYKRHYPYGHLTAHIIGYINNTNQKDLDALEAAGKAKNYLSTTKIGRTGLERQYESELHGQSGYSEAEISRTGRTVRVLNKVDPVPGDDLYLSLDIDLQAIFAEELAVNQYDGAAVAINPNNGEIMGMFSNPSFDANLFVNGISHADYQRLSESPRKNLFNRALNGNYAPASTIKPMLSLAALHHYVTTPDITIDCSGSYRIPEHEETRRFFCWKRQGGHGAVDNYRALVESCDVYYYTIGKALGIARIHSYLSQFGLGKKTGIDLPSESPGILPTREFKNEKYNTNWFIGDTINASIGQGYMVTTPLQLAQFTAVLATKGKAYQPHLVTHYRPASRSDKVKKAYPEPTTVEQNNPNAWQSVSEALIGVMTDKMGTANKIEVNLPFDIAGKTGTAQVFSFEEGERIAKDDLEKRLRDNSLFIAYAPAEKPEIALALVLENAGGGSERAAPKAIRMLERYFALKSSE